MKLPFLPPLPGGLSPLNVLPGLKMPSFKVGLAELARVRRTWDGSQADMAASGGRVLQPVAEFGPNPGALRMLRFAPEGLAPGAPLVVVLHGCTQTAAGYDRGTGWSTLASRHGFALLYPEQQRANNANGCFNWFEPGDVTRDGGEVASIRSMVAATVATLGCDPSRVFVTGLSAGGAMTAALLATYPEVFAAGAIVAGLPYGAAQSTQGAFAAMYRPVALPAADRGGAVQAASPAPGRKPVVSIWQGDADRTVMPANATELAKQWCHVHGLDERRGETTTADGASRQAWRAPDGTVRVEMFTVRGLAHGVPVSTAAAGDRGVGETMPYVLEAGVSATWHSAQHWGLLRA